MIRWLIQIAAPYLAKRLLMSFGRSPEAAAKLAPRVIQFAREGAALVGELMSKGEPEEKAAEKIAADGWTETGRIAFDTRLDPKD